MRSELALSIDTMFNRSSACVTDTMFSRSSALVTSSGVHVVSQVLIPAMKHVIDRSSAFGVESFVIGMPHR